LKASHEVCGGSILAHKTAKIAKASGTDFVAIQLYSAQTLNFPSMSTSLRDLWSFCADSLRAMAAPPRATAVGDVRLPSPGSLGDRTLPTQA